MSCKRLCFLCSLINFFFVVQICFGATEVIQTGVASPQDNSEVNNVEKLRQRAIRNALDLAQMQVVGVNVSSRRSNDSRFREKMSSGSEVTSDVTAENRYSNSSTSQTEGHSRLLEIVKEWQEGGQYYVRAKIAVDSKEQVEQQKKCGYYWMQAGKPSISIHFTEVFNGEVIENQYGRTPRSLRDTLDRNGVHVSTGTKNDSQYLIRITQTITTQQVTDFIPVTMHIRLAFQIIDQARGESLAEYQAVQGPIPGFSENQARDDSLKIMIPEVAENMVRSLAVIMNQQRNNGAERRIIIAGMPGGIVFTATEILSNLYQVTGSTPSDFEKNTFSMSVFFKGESADLNQRIVDAFEREGWHIKSVKINNSVIYLQWVKINQR
jgi:hypothetical protein